MALYKEIVTKAVIGKGKKQFTDNLSLQVTNNPNTILGCWVINHNFSGTFLNGTVTINGSYDINIWYSYDNDSKTTVINKKIEYNDLFNVKLRENADLSGSDIIVRSLKQPTCFSVNVEDDDMISFNIEKELGVEIVGETKVKIAVEDDEEPWDEIVDDVDEDTLKEIDEKVSEDYLSAE